MTLEKQFYDLIRKWEVESCFLSSTSDMKKCPGFQTLVNLGWSIVPLILKKLEGDSYYNFWFIILLFEITGENPVAEENKGYIARMTQDWVNWGKEKGIKSENL